MKTDHVTTLAGDLPAHELTAYLCHKTVHVMPMMRGEYNNRRGWAAPANEDPSDAGFIVIYGMDTDKQHISWLPQDVFLEGYQPLPEHLGAGGDQDLWVRRCCDQLSISIGINALTHAITVGPTGLGTSGFAIANPDVFLDELVRGLQDEEEDGSTPLHRMLDDVVEALAEQGADGLTYDLDEEE